MNLKPAIYPVNKIPNTYIIEVGYNEFVVWPSGLVTVLIDYNSLVLNKNNERL